MPSSQIRPFTETPSGIALTVLRVEASVPVTSKVVEFAVSFAFFAIYAVYVPVGTISFCAVSSNRYISLTSNVNVTVFVSFGASSIFSKPLSCFAGVVPLPAFGCET